LFPVVPLNYQKYRNRDGNRQSRGENTLFWKAYLKEKRRRATST
jgi:hypothetical protein